MSSLDFEGPSLRRIQEWMAARILGPMSGELGEHGTALDEWLCVPAPHRAADRLSIYQNGYPVRVRDALAETYPAVAHLLGEPAFGALAGRYAAAVPLTSYNLGDAGALMPAFLRADALARERPFLPDLATLEWRVAVAFHATEHPPLDPRALAWSVDEWASAVLRFQPAVGVVSSVWPILDLWAGRETRPAIAIERHDRPADAIVHRAGLVVRCELVSANEALALRLLLDGHCLAETAERLEAVGGEPDAVLAWFNRWTSAGLITAADAGDELRKGARSERGPEFHRTAPKSERVVSG